MTTYTYTGHLDSVTLAGQVFVRHTPVDVSEPGVIAAIGTFEPAGDFTDAAPKAPAPTHKPATKPDPAPKPPPTPPEAVQAPYPHDGRPGEDQPQANPPLPRR